MTDAPVAFDPAGPLPTGMLALEASAGTGKTYALTALAVRFIAERDIAVSQLCIVTFTEAATAELRGRIRARLVEALDHLDGGGSSGDPVLTALAAVEPEVRAARLRRAIADFDTATISTIHGFCRRILAGRGADRARIVDGHREIDEATADVLLAQMYGDPSIDLPFTGVRNIAATHLRMPDSQLWTGGRTPARGSFTTNQLEQIAMIDDVVEAVDAIVDTVDHRRRAAGTTTFDMLLRDARDRLEGPDASTVVASLRDRYRVVLIDEFQDTDHLQWGIFHQAFVDSFVESDRESDLDAAGAAGPHGEGREQPTVVIVGDPKQSIYRFRSADLSAYLKAVHRADEVATLTRNWRSDQPLLDALEVLMAGFEFGSPEIAFTSVDAPENHRSSRLGGRGRSPLEIRVVEPPGSDAFGAARARRAVRRDVVAVVADLLDGSTTLSVDGDHSRAVRPGDIAILTRSNADAIGAARALSRAGIPAATASNESVLASDAAGQYKVLLRALERPEHAGRVRAAALGWFIGVTVAELAALNDDELADLHHTIRGWGDLLVRRGFPALVAELGAAGVAKRVLSRVGGERDLTDLDHVSELLAATLEGPTTATAALEVLRDLAAAGDGEQLDLDLVARRIDRDDDAVQVMTVHRAKGLEFPIVLVPYLWTSTRSGDGVPHAAIGNQRYIDATKISGATSDAITGGFGAFVQAELQGEARRLLYVALTRAVSCCIVWWAPTIDSRGEVTSATSPLGMLLAHRFGDVPRRADPIDQLGAGVHGALAAVPVSARSVPPRPDGARASSDRTIAGDLACAVAERTLDTAWRIWSFTSITAAATAGESLRPDAPVIGGADESPVDPGALAATVARDQPPDTPLAGAPAGAAFGTLVHAVLEHTEFERLGEPGYLAGVCAEQLRYRAVSIDPVQLASGLETALRAPLGGPLGARTLEQLRVADRLDELPFHLRLGRFTANAIAAVLADTLGADDPMHAWAVARAADDQFDFAVEGRLTGSVDLVARFDLDGVDRYLVADYKTNDLGGAADYAPDALVRAMSHHDYQLQAVLYLVALHRYLRGRVVGYHPDEHLLGSAYLFLRGMRPVNGEAQGVCWWRPRSAAIIAVDELLAGGDDLLTR